MGVNIRSITNHNSTTNLSIQQFWRDSCTAVMLFSICLKNGWLYLSCTIICIFHGLILVTNAKNSKLPSFYFFMKRWAFLLLGRFEKCTFVCIYSYVIKQR